LGELQESVSWDLRRGTEEEAYEALTKVYDVTPERARLAVETATVGLREERSLKKNEISLYVGIPFCPTRCAYCSFVAQSVEKSFALVEPYLEALFDEIRSAGAMVRERGLHGGLTLSEETADIRGGLLLRQGNIEVNCAVETLMGLYRSSLATQVANILFA